MEYYNNIQAVTYNDISDIMPLGTLKSCVHRGNVTKLRRACYDNPALYSVESFPLKYRKAIKEKFSEEMKEDATTKLLDAEEIKTDMQAVKFYSEYVLTDGRHLPSDKQTEYTNNASILNRCKEIYQISCERRNRTSGTRIKKGEFWKKVSDKLTKLQEDFPNSLPTDTMRLQKKYNDYQKRGYEAMISGKFMNKNNAKIDNGEQQATIISLLSDYRNFYDTQVAEFYNTVAKAKGWKEITVGTVANWRKKYELEIYAGRKGANKFRLYKTMQNKRERPKAALLYWSADGWDVELAYQRETINKDGKKVTTYHNRLTMVVVTDTCIDYPVGYAIGEYESGDLIKRALRDAVNHTKALFGQRMGADQYQSDHFAISKLTQAYQSIADKFTPARVKNSRSKTVERYFLTLNDKYAHLEKNWTGHGVKSQLQPNDEMLNIIRHDIPTFEECVEQIAGIVEKEREQKIEQYRALYEKLPEERKYVLSNEQYLLNFGNENHRKNGVVSTNKLEGSGMNVTINGEKRHYDCFDMEFRKHSYEDWVIKYAPEDLSEVLAVNKDGSLRYMLEEKHLQPMALAERKEGDSEELQRVFDYNKSIERHVMDVICSAQDRTRRFLLDNA
ncbi:MAG: hypothetical protein IJ759_01005, partial [Bacteroidales bacterium]|nr:hypothetical protein [Bacteroidales bacterium]